MLVGVRDDSVLDTVWGQVIPGVFPCARSEPVTRRPSQFHAPPSLCASSVVGISTWKMASGGASAPLWLLPPILARFPPKTSANPAKVRKGGASNLATTPRLGCCCGGIYTTPLETKQHPLQPVPCTTYGAQAMQHAPNLSQPIEETSTPFVCFAESCGRSARLEAF